MLALKNSAQLRDQIESDLFARIPSALSPRQRVERDHISCGINVTDQLLYGGLAIGTLTEFVGAECSGRMTVALAYAAAIIQTGNVCAWIDVADSLDPESAAANGVDLERLLWVRCGSRPTSPIGCVDKHSAPVVADTSPPRHTGGGSPHPHSEGRNMPQAIGALLNAHGGLYDKQLRREMKSVGTPGMPNRPLSQSSKHREEQINFDRLPPRRGDNLAKVPRCSEPQPQQVAYPPSDKRLLGQQSASSAPKGPWQALDQALRATDLLLQSGGFSSIVLDLGGTSPELAWRIPLATWFRFRAACERTRVSLMLLTQHPCARSSAEHVLRLQPGTFIAQSRVITGVRYSAATERSRSDESAHRIIPIRKPPQSERPDQWISEAPWAQGQ